MPLPGVIGRIMNLPTMAYDLRASYHSITRPPTPTRCLLPLKKVSAGTLDLEALWLISDESHKLEIRLAIDILSGLHPLWRALLTGEQMPPPCGTGSGLVHDLRAWQGRVKGCKTRVEWQPRRSEPSPILQSHVADLERWGVVNPLGRRERCTMSTVFLTPKSCGTRSRALYDARPQNACLNWCTMPDHGRFRLPRPLHQIMVGTAHGLEGPVFGAELDFCSFFFLFRWGFELQRAHAFRVGTRPYKFAVPVQGSSVMPWIAQATSLALVGGPLLTDDPCGYVADRLAVTYDNILLVDEPHRLHRRLADLKQRSAKIGAVVGSVQGPTDQRIASCGIEYDLVLRAWRLKEEWVGKVLQFLDSYPAEPLFLQQQTLAGYAVWLCRATLQPLSRVMPLLLHEKNHVALEFMASQLRENRFRKLWPTASLHLPDKHELVYVDASLDAAGMVWRGRERTVSWDSRRPMEEQQEAEADAAGLALKWVASELEGCDPVVLAMDNLGVLFMMVMGAPRTRAQRDLMDVIEGTAKWPVWAAFVRGVDNPADAPSRARELGPIDPALDRRVSAAAIPVEWTCAQR